MAATCCYVCPRRLRAALVMCPPTCPALHESCSRPGLLRSALFVGLAPIPPRAGWRAGWYSNPVRVLSPASFAHWETRFDPAPNQFMNPPPPHTGVLVQVDHDGMCLAQAGPPPGRVRVLGPQLREIVCIHLRLPLERRVFHHLSIRRRQRCRGRGTAAVVAPRPA